MVSSIGLAQADLNNDKHEDLMANSLDWPVGQLTEFRLQTDALDNPDGGSKVVYDDVVAMPGMAWLRLYFGHVSLDRGSYIRITSLRDGEQQRMDAATLEMWSYGSAYFNGDAVRVELIAGPFSENNVLEIEYVASEPIAHGRGDNCGICGADNRAPVNNSSNNFARIMPVGCSATIYNESSCFVTAGHCLGSATVLHFNVPDSSNNCQTNNPPVADQFPVTSSDGVDAGVGADYGAMSSGTNSEGQTAYERYGTFVPLASSVPNSGDLDITGYGVDSECNRSQTEQYHGGPILSVNSDTITYEVDVTYGNSGSSILYNNQVIGVVTHCSYGCENYGTRIDISGFQSIIASVCSGGGDPPDDAPENDDCAGAIVTGTGLTDFTTVGGTTSTDTYNDAQCTGTYLGEMNDDVWFSYSPSASGTLTVSTCDLVNFDTDLVVYDGTCGNKTQVACNGDGSDCSGYSSILTVDVSSGSNYLIRVGGWDGSATGSGQLSLALEGVPDPTGACCVGSSCSVGTAAECANDGGDYQGDDTDCSDDPCYTPPPTGACCVGSNCSVGTEDECNSAGGNYLGDDTDCSDDPCYVPPTGACCIGRDCSVGTQDACKSAGGLYLGDDTNCSGDPCFVPPPTGACCVGSDCSVDTEAACSSAGGNYLGDDTDCSGDPCYVPPATGGCCIGSNCSVGTQDACNSAGGDYLGDDTDCSGDPCYTPPATGGCCVGASCSVGTEAACDSSGGTYLGDDSDCSGNPCGSDPGEIGFVHAIVGANLVDDPEFNWTVDLYVSVPEGGRVDAVAGTGSTQKVLTSTGLFYQNQYGGPLSTDVNPSFYEFEPALEWDSRVTIGALDSTGNPFPSNDMGTIGIDFTDFENGLGLTADNGLWYVLPTDAQGAGQTFVGSDCETRKGVLVARLTNFGAEAQIQFQALIQGRDANDNAWQQELDSTFGYIATVDCNENGINDACDIANGTSPDTDGNGVPDECESGCVGDYDGNGQTNIDDILYIISYWNNPYTVEDLLTILDDYNCGG
ncbi:MAG: hypothetical protein VX527_07860 [Planctomycetota bacterium]|nr:hypothetical protein [Planctomycetota bacterium]